jgi:hypothetical protein|tara:strand:- start:312 stop:506 length:195 start_codon:yes stop_codon:yes gene_type:complete
VSAELHRTFRPVAFGLLLGAASRLLGLECAVALGAPPSRIRARLLHRPLRRTLSLCGEAIAQEK